MENYSGRLEIAETQLSQKSGNESKYKKKYQHCISHSPKMMPVDIVLY